MMEETKGKHLELIQNVVARMANNSFLLKGWTVTLVAALFALSARDSNPIFSILALFPALAFWGLDAFYLRQERLYRRLYEEICNAIDGESMPVTPYSLNTAKVRKEVHSWWRTLWSPTILLIHGMTVMLILIVLGAVYFAI
jgi:hypothetical protein